MPEAGPRPAEEQLNNRNTRAYQQSPLPGVPRMNDPEHESDRQHEKSHHASVVGAQFETHQECHGGYPKSVRQERCHLHAPSLRRILSHWKALLECQNRGGKHSANLKSNAAAVMETLLPLGRITPKPPKCTAWAAVTVLLAANSENAMVTVVTSAPVAADIARYRTDPLRIRIRKEDVSKGRLFSDRMAQGDLSFRPTFRVADRELRAQRDLADGGF